MLLLNILDNKWENKVEIIGKNNKEKLNECIKITWKKEILKNRFQTIENREYIMKL